MPIKHGILYGFMPHKRPQPYHIGRRIAKVVRNSQSRANTRRKAKQLKVDATENLLRKHEQKQLARKPAEVILVKRNGKIERGYGKIDDINKHDINTLRKLRINK